MVRLFGRALCLLGLSVSVAGCYSKATAYDGKFTFAYASGVEVDNFIKPIAPGAKLDVVAFSNGTEETLAITKATSSQRSVLTIDKVDNRTLTLKGVSPGVAEIEITARDDSGKLGVDRMFFHVAKPSVHALEHSCTEGPEATYVRGENVDIFHRMATGDRRHVIGYGYAPVTVDPKGALELVSQPQGWGLYRFKAPAVNGSVKLRSGIDGGVLSIAVVDRASLTEAKLAHDDRLLEGSSSYAVAKVLRGAQPVCNQNALTRARSLTPDICAVSARLDDEPGEDENHEQLVSVKGLKFGDCAYEVTLPELSGGRGVVLKATAKVGRLKSPRGHGTSRTRMERLLAGISVPLASTLSRLILAAVIVVAVEGRRRKRERE